MERLVSERIGRIEKGVSKLGRVRMRIESIEIGLSKLGRVRWRKWNK